ncbi:MAG: lipoate--protein ligase family protein [Gemmatimonadales bacterium]
MAADRALLDFAAQEGVVLVRLYRWQPFCLSFGCNEPALRRYDRRRIDDLGIDTVRRPTGGRAVWHARELTYAVAAPEDAFGPLRAAYLALHAMLARAVRRLGGDAVLAPEPASAAPLESGPCFARPAGGEVLVRGRKVVGSAQVRIGSAFLQHGSILLEDDQAVAAEVTAGRAGSGGELPLSRALGRSVEWEEAAEAVTAEFGAQLGAEPGLLPPAALEPGIQRNAPVFRSEEWTWRR